LSSQLKTALAERDRKLTSYSFSAESQQDGEVARHTFQFRSPNKMRGALTEPSQLEWAYDGTTLTQTRPREHKLLVYQLKLPPQKASIYLHDTFAPFVFEGFRVPLLPPTGATAKLHDDKLEVFATLSDEGGPVEVRYLFRWPSADFLAKSSVVKGARSELRVDEEYCDTTLKLCVPKKVTQYTEGTLVGSTTLSNIVLGAELPNDSFTLKAGEGWATETHEVVESPAP
jgi:outer membrane lipoprotein-sorting protein